MAKRARKPKKAETAKEESNWTGAIEDVIDDLSAAAPKPKPARPNYDTLPPTEALTGIASDVRSLAEVLGISTTIPEISADILTNLATEAANNMDDLAVMLESTAYTANANDSTAEPIRAPKQPPPRPPNSAPQRKIWPVKAKS